MREIGGSDSASSVMTLHGRSGGPQSGPAHGGNHGMQTVGKLPPWPPAPLALLLLLLALVLGLPPSPPVPKSRGAGEQADAKPTAMRAIGTTRKSRRCKAIPELGGAGLVASSLSCD